MEGKEVATFLVSSPVASSPEGLLLVVRVETGNGRPPQLVERNGGRLDKGKGTGDPVNRSRPRGRTFSSSESPGRDPTPDPYVCWSRLSLPSPW